MNFLTTSDNPLQHACSVLTIGAFEDEPGFPPFLLELNEKLQGLVHTLYEMKEFNGKLTKTKLIYCFGKLPAERILFVGLGKRSELTVERMRQAAGTAVQAVAASGLKKFATCLHMSGPSLATPLSALLEGTLLGSYSFTTYKSKKETETDIEEVTVLVEASQSDLASKIIEESRVIGEAVFFARDLVSQPANVAIPSYLAEKARELSGMYGLNCRIVEPDEMERYSMNALLAVSRGSRQPPRFIILEYQGGEGSPAVLVGKGVTFDSGGISLKPRDGMEKMKTDMAGAAAVMGAMMAVAALALPINVVGLIPAVENLPGGNAYKPGDVIRSMSGQTIEIVNTDAEGRLILCDALHYARKYDPAVLIDIATLTGACVVALGSVASGLLGNDENLKQKVREAGETSGERVWELPLWEEYGELMKSDIADMKNAGGATAGTISAGWFLQQFVRSVPWIHLDIAGTAWEEKGKPCQPKGATGIGVRLLVEYLRNHFGK